MIITWTSTAKISYFKNIEFLIKIWNLKVAQEFILEVEKTMDIIKTNSNCFKKWDYDPNYSIGFIHQNISFYYRIHESEIVVHLFWNNLQNPKKLNKTLLK